MSRPVTLSRADARALALRAQGFADPRPAGAVDRRHVRRVLRRIHLLQLDSINVVVRSHYLPLFSRLGPYPRALVDRMAYRDRELIELWAHEASLVPAWLHPLLRWRMHRVSAGEWWKTMAYFSKERAGYVDAVLAEVAERGPLTAGELDDPGASRGAWWGWADGKRALEFLFAMGHLAVADRRNFERVYDLTERVLPRAVLDEPTPPDDVARKKLLVLAADALGVATDDDLLDYWRIRGQRRGPLVPELVEEGELVAADVEGWGRTAYVRPSAAGRRRRPADACALLSPFDSLVWHRPRTERLFDFHLRLEVYVPRPKRTYGYYVLPFLLGDRLVGRVDLKADRREGALLVPGAFVEDGVDPRVVVEPLATELRRMVTWLELDRVEVGDRGELSGPLRRACASASLPQSV